MKRKATRWLLAAAAILMVAVCIGGKAFYRPSDIVMTLDGYDITKAHLALYEKDFRGIVASYFYQTYGQDPNEEGFWEKEVEGQVPGQVLRNRALDQAVWDMTERIEARKHGIETQITLDEISRALEEKNKTRQKGAGTYGPEQYGLSEYLSRTQMDAKTALQEVLLKEELAPSRDQLAEIYDNADSSLFSKGFQARAGIYLYYGMKTGEYPEVLEQVWDFVTETLAQNQEPEKIVAMVRERFHIEIDYEEVECDTDHMPRDNQEAAWLVDQLEGKETGWISGPLDYGASQGIIKVLDMKDYGTADLEEAQGILISLWLEDAYPSYIKSRMEEYGYQGEHQ